MFSLMSSVMHFHVVLLLFTHCEPETPLIKGSNKNLSKTLPHVMIKDIMLKKRRVEMQQTFVGKGEGVGLFVVSCGLDKVNPLICCCKSI